MYAIRTGAALVGIWTFAKHHDLQQEVLDGVRALPGFIGSLIELAVLKVVDLLTPGGDRA